MANANNRQNRQTVSARPSIKVAAQTIAARLSITASSEAKGYSPLTQPIMVEGYGKQTVLGLHVDIGNGQTEIAKWIGQEGDAVKFSAFPKPGYQPLTFFAYAALRGFTPEEVASVLRTRTGQRADGSTWTRSFLVGHLPELTPKHAKTPTVVPADARAVVVDGL